MKILSVNTSNKVASIALFEDKKLINEKYSDEEKTHSEKLLPLIDELLKEEDITIKDIEMFVVSVGPGSFTGIRIGVATVKGMAQALNKKVIAVTSLEGLLEMANSDNACAIINAKHGNVYAQIKRNGELLEPDCYEINELMNKLNSFEKKFVFAGDATIEYADMLKDFDIVDKKYEMSSDIGNFGLKKYFDNNEVAKRPHDIVPIYLRKAQPDRDGK